VTGITYLPDKAWRLVVPGTGPTRRIKLGHFTNHNRSVYNALFSWEGVMMAKRAKPNRVTEDDVAKAALKVLTGCPNGEASIQKLVREIPKHLTAPSKTRRGEELWEQQIRNITFSRRSSS
jgi:hypothetical protein